MTDDQLDRFWNADHLTRSLQQALGWAAHQRHLAHKRDGGVCAECGSTFEGRRAMAEHQRGWVYWLAVVDLPGIPCPDSLGRWADEFGSMDAARATCTMPAQWGLFRWPALKDARTVDVRAEYDHRVPLWAGGPNTLENLQTLCVPCHRAKTKREAGERARLRREARRARDPQLAIEASA